MPDLARFRALNGKLPGPKCPTCPLACTPGTAGSCTDQPLGRYALMNASRSALIVAASVVGMPCGKPLYVFSVPFFNSFADSGAESAYGTI